MANTPGFKLFVGIDVSKEKFDVCCIDDTGEKLFRFNDFNGIIHLRHV